MKYKILTKDTSYEIWFKFNEFSSRGAYIISILDTDISADKFKDYWEFYLKSGDEFMNCLKSNVDEYINWWDIDFIGRQCKYEIDEGYEFNVTDFCIESLNTSPQMKDKARELIK